MTKPNPPLIGVHNLYKRYGAKSILKGVNLAIGEGEVVALLGANGAGKSTLLRIIAGLLKADRGDILLSGVPIQKASTELRRYIGFVSHAPLLYEHLSGLENLTFFAELYDLQQHTERIEATLQAVDLWRRRHDLVRTYSRGMQQRLAIARAILHDPPVLLLDEPDTGLDQQSSHMLQSMLAQLSDKRRAILFSTHNLDRALTWANSVAMLIRGTITDHASTTILESDALGQLHIAAGVKE
ncbi:MAG: heme ABC exporter ATP-binding protein CcmA [Caldilineaceae bacterium]|nr:heme ABC exporter ATP-binding protein CcmA [Caldilineaceae bacterium]